MARQGALYVRGEEEEEEEESGSEEDGGRDGDRKE